MWHMTRLMHRNQHLQHTKKLKKQPENWLAYGWQKIQGSKQREIELISKKIWRKRKEKMFRLRSWLLLHVKQYKTCCWRTFNHKMYNIARYLARYILLVDNHYYYYYFTFILSKSEFGFYKSHIYGLFTPVNCIYV